MPALMGVVGCVSNTVSEMEFEWAIPDYFSLKYDTISNWYIASPSFKFSGCYWSIHVYPCGKDSDGWISVYLNRKDNGHFPVHLRYSISVKLASETDILKTKMFSNNFQGRMTWGWKKFMKQISVYSSRSLILLCHVKQMNSREESMLQREMTELETLSRDFKDLFKNKSDKCDIIINVKGVEFRAHRTILIARSPVLAAALETDMLENQTGVIDIKDCDSDSFQDFLLYLYTGWIKKLSYKNAYHLFPTAHKYNVKGLRSLCADLIAQNIALDNFCEVAMLANLFDEAELLHSVRIFFNRNFSKVIAKPDWESLLESNHQLVNKLLRSLSSKDEV